MTPNERTEAQLDTFLDPAPHAGPLKLRPFSAGTLTLCRKLGLTMVVGSEAEKNALGDDEKQRQITTLLFIQSAPIETVKNAQKLARTDRQAFEDSYLLDFELNLPVDALAPALEALMASADRVAAAQFETKPKETGAASVETAPPNS